MMVAYNFQDMQLPSFYIAAAIVFPRNRFRGAHPNLQKATRDYAAC